MCVNHSTGETQWMNDCNGSHADTSRTIRIANARLSPFLEWVDIHPFIIVKIEL